MKPTKYQDYKDLVEHKGVEFNQMSLYLMRLNGIMERKDQAYETGETYNFYRSTMSLFSNVLAKLEQEKIEGLKEAELQLLEIGREIRSIIHTVRADNLKEKNLFLAEEKLLRFNTDLNRLIMKSGLIFPKKEFKTVKELRSEDYDN